MNAQDAEILARMVVRPVEDPLEIDRWDEAMALWHPLRSSTMVGPQIRYVAEANGEWLALLGWSQAALKTQARDHWIGWSEIQKRQRLHLVVQNSRFLVMPTFRRMTNLASRCLGLNVRRLSMDWQQRYKHRLILAETFVEPPRFPGICYVAAGWKEVGVTSGFRREGRAYRHHGISRTVLVRELEPGARRQLCGPTLAEDKALPRVEPAIQPIEADDGLFTIIREHVQDPRERRGRCFRLESLLGTVLVGMLAGHSTCEEIARWARRLREHEKQRLRLPMRRWGATRDTPCANTLRNLLRILPEGQLEKAAAAYVKRCGINGQNTHLAMDGKTLCGSATKDQPAQVQVTLYRTDTGIVIDQIAVPRGTTEVVAARTLLERNNITCSVISADAAHANAETVGLIKKGVPTSPSTSRTTSLVFWRPSRVR